VVDQRGQVMKVTFGTQGQTAAGNRSHTSTGYSQGGLVLKLLNKLYFELFKVLSSGDCKTTELTREP
jgi:hypothetical protein